ncbi:MAG: HIT family hydrolase [Deltaproteobacteria bacterium]|nr:MAG: HIT family hydrolase [Deltaproteobacteria bacterium]
MSGNLWAPWRTEYVGRKGDKGCVFCLAAKKVDDPESLVVKEGERALVIMNRFPYNTAHMMVIPKRHIGCIEELTPEELTEMHSLLVAAKGAVDGLYLPDGYNVGFNLGAAAGAGIVDHIHLHVVPRWQGDVNLMPVLADVKVIPEHLERTYAAIKERLNEK